MSTPLPTFDNLPWNNARPVSFSATMPGSLVAGDVVFDATAKFDLVPSERASAGSLFMFDSWSLGSNISEADWQAAIDTPGLIQVYSAQSHETIFRTPIPMLRQTDWSPLRMAWLPAGDPSSLSVSVSARLSGPTLLAYPAPVCRFNLLAYEVTDTTYIQSILKGWGDLSAAGSGSSLSGGGVRLVAGAQVLREYHP